jgi:hypothetical protein
MVSYRLITQNIQHHRTFAGRTATKFMPHRGRLVKFPDLHPSPIERNSRYRAKRSIRGGWLRRRPAKIDTNGRHDAAAGLQESLRDAALVFTAG